MLPARRLPASLRARLGAALLVALTAARAEATEPAGAPAEAAPAPASAPVPSEPATPPAPAAPPEPAPPIAPSAPAAYQRAYPPDARVEGVQGTVLLALEVRANGTVRAATVLRGVRADVDADARRRATSLRFPPTSAPVARTHAVTYALGLRDDGATDTPVASLVIDVVGADGAPIPGAQVSLVRPANPSGPPPPAGVTGKAGRLRVPFLPPGDWRVRVEAPGYAVAEGWLALSAGSALAVTVPLVGDAPSATFVWGYARAWHAPARPWLGPEDDPVDRSILTRVELARVPGSGEAPLRALSALPGLSADIAGPDTPSVRGAAPDTLLVLLDGVPVPGPRSVAGLTALVEPEAVERLELTPGVGSAELPATTGGVLAIDSWAEPWRDDRPRDVDGSVVLDAREARLTAAQVVAGVPDLVVAVGARRSYAAASMWALGAAGLLDTPRAAPEHDAVSLRLRWTPGNHRLRLSLLRASGQLDVAADADRLVPILGAFTLDDTLALATVDHRWASTRASLTSVASVAYATQALDRADAVTDQSVAQVFLRSDGSFDAWDRQRIHLGVYGQLRDHVVTGPVDDTRAVPTWAAIPQADLGLGTVQVAASGWQPQVAAYAEHRWDGPVHTRLGARATWVGRTGEVLPGPSAGVAIPLPTGTIPRVMGGLYHHIVEDPLRVDAALGTPDLGAERAWQLVVGVDQALPIAEAARLRVEGHVAKLEELAVNPDTPEAVAAGTRPTNDGYGRNLGLDVSFDAVLARLTVQAHLTLLHATRTNPLNTRFPDDLVPAHAEAASGSFSLGWQASPALRLAARYEHRAGLPISSVEAGGPDVVALAALDDQRLGDRRTLDVRAEWQRSTARLRYAVYVDVLNVLNLPDPLLRTATVADGVLVQGAVPQLPIRPFLGIQAEF